MKPITANYDPETQQVTVTLKGVTKTLTVRSTSSNPDLLVSNQLAGVCQHRTGTKLYPTSLHFWRKGDQWVLSTQYCCHNRQARLVGWKEDNQVQQLHANYQ